ncbi:MAG: zinc-dependent alcohol dehydrogenase family protein [Syntrophomonadaceae bacterium]
MQAALFTGLHKINVTDYQIPPLGPDELLIRVGACGVCGTDFHIFEGNAPAKPPVILGHEYTGEIVDKGRDVQELKIGDRVAVNPNIHCNYCEFCRKGKINLCLNLKALGVTVNGGFSEYSVVPRTQAHLIPENFPFRISAFSEPLSCCVHGINQASVKTGDTVSIVGAGTIGLLMQQLARLNGASKTFVYDISEKKRDIAAALGADEVCSPDDNNAVQTLRDKTNGGTDIVIECVGSPAAAEFALKQVKKGGTLVIFGLAGPKAFINLYLQSFFHKELTIKSSILNPNTFQTAVDLLVAGKIRTDLLNLRAVNLRNDEISALFNEPKDSAVIKYMVMPES